mgnify:CR=1 FL=1
MTKEQEALARAVFADLRKTYPQMTWELVEAEASKVLAGQKGKGVIGVWLQDAFRRAGWLEA